MQASQTTLTKEIAIVTPAARTIETEPIIFQSIFLRSHAISKLPIRFVTEIIILITAAETKVENATYAFKTKKTSRIVTTPTSPSQTQG